MIIGNMTSVVSKAKNAISNTNKSFANHMNLLSSTWIGEISDAYKNLYRRFTSRMGTTLNYYNSLGSKIDSLEQSIKRADDEEARKTIKKKWIK